MPEPTPPEQADQSWRDEWSDAPMMSSEPQPSPDEWADAEAAPKKRAQEDAFSWTEDPAAADVRPRPDSNAAISWPDEPIEAPPPISWSDEIVAGPAPAQAPPAQAAPAQDPVTGTQRSKKLQSAPTAEQENLDKLNELRTKLGSMPAKIPNTLPGPAPAPSPGQRASSPAVSPYAPTIPQEALQPKPGDPYYAGQAEARRGAMGSRSSVLWIGLIVLGIVILGIVIAVVLLG